MFKGLILINRRFDAISVRCSYEALLDELAQDPTAENVLSEFEEQLASLIEIGYVTLHLSNSMPFWDG